MEIKSLQEIKSILSKFKNAGGVGFVVTPQLLKIASQLGLMGYDEALARWYVNSVFDSTTETKEAKEMLSGLIVTWEGTPLWKDIKNNIHVGLKRTIEDIELLLK